MVSLRFFALLPFAVSALASPLATRDVVTVENDITQKIGPQITKLNNDINGFPASGLAGAVTIHSDVLTLVASVNIAINNIKSTGSFDILSGTAILADIQLLVPNFLATLVAIGAQEPSWADIQGGSALTLSDLRSLNTVLGNYADAVIAAVPLSLEAGAIAIKAQITGAFTTAIAAYSGPT